MGQLAVDENETIFALALDRGQKGLDHRRLVHRPVGNGGRAARKADLPHRARPHPAFRHHTVTGEVIKRRRDVPRPRRLWPQGGDRGHAAQGQFAQVTLVGVPAHHIQRIADPHPRRRQRGQTRDKRILGAGIIPSGADQRQRNPGEILHRRAPIGLDHLYPAAHQTAARQTGAQSRHLMIVQPRLHPARGGAGQRIRAGEKNDFCGHGSGLAPACGRDKVPRSSWRATGSATAIAIRQTPAPSGPISV